MSAPPPAIPVGTCVDMGRIGEGTIIDVVRGKSRNRQLVEVAGKTFLMRRGQLMGFGHAGGREKDD